MDTIKALMNRRSIRRFTPTPVAPQAREVLVRAALQAPSAGDARPWHLVEIDDRERLDGLAAAMPGCDMLREAPYGLLICGDPSLEKIPGFWVQDCSAATQNVLLAVTALGLGGVWIGLHPVAERADAVRAALRIPKAIVPLALVAAGHPAEDPGREDRYDADKRHINRW